MIILDVETGGLDPAKNPLLSIGAVEYENPANEIYIKVAPFPGLEVTKEALEINGIDLETWGGIPLAHAMQQFAEWANSVPNKMLVGQNVSFDRDFIRANCERVGLKSPFGYRTIDIHTLGYVALMRAGRPLDKTSMDDIYEFLKMPKEPKPHRAIVGARLEREAFSRLLTFFL